MRIGQEKTEEVTLKEVTKLTNINVNITELGLTVGSVTSTSKLNGDTIIEENSDSFSIQLPEDKEVAMLDPTTGQATGSTHPVASIYAMLYSLYSHCDTLNKEAVEARRLEIEELQKDSPLESDGSSSEDANTATEGA